MWWGWACTVMLPCRCDVDGRARSRRQLATRTYVDRTGILGKLMLALQLCGAALLAGAVAARPPLLDSALLELEGLQFEVAAEQFRAVCTDDTVLDQRWLEDAAAGLWDCGDAPAVLACLQQRGLLTTQSSPRAHRVGARAALSTSLESHSAASLAELTRQLEYASTLTGGDDLGFSRWCADTLRYRLGESLLGARIWARAVQQTPAGVELGPVEIDRLEWAIQAIAGHKDMSVMHAELVKRRQAIDVKALWSSTYLPSIQLNPTLTGATRLSDLPALFAADSFASPEDCAAIIAAGFPHLRESTVGDNTQNANKRTSANAHLVEVQLNVPAVRRTLQRAAALLGIRGIRASDFEMQLVRYRPGGHYGLHTDSELNARKGSNSMAQQYQLRAGLERHVSMLLFLNDVEDGEGGETAFPAAQPLVAVDLPRGGVTAGRQLTTAETRRVREDRNQGVVNCSSVARQHGLAIAPRVGRLLVWYNYDSDGALEQRSVHAGCDVGSGEKFVANIWLNTVGGSSRLVRQPVSQSTTSAHQPSDVLRGHHLHQDEV